jgi:hypothetical protein
MRPPVALDIICLATWVYLPLFSSMSQAQRIAMATNAAMVDFM